MNCTKCGIEFDSPNKVGRPRRYCDECRQPTKPSVAQPHTLRDCPICGTSFMGRVGRIYCARACSETAKTIRNGLSCRDCGKAMTRSSTSATDGEARCNECRRLRPKKLRASGPQTFTCLACEGEWSRPSSRGQVPKWCPSCRGNKRMQACFTCGEVKAISKGGTKNCSECWDLIKPRRSKALVLYVKPEREQPKVVHVRTSSRLTSGRCRVCSAWFVSHHLDVTCSAECKSANDREAKHRDRARRRALERNAFRAPVYRKKVFEADGYRCHLCNKKTDPTKVVPHPKAPTVDHVIPLARGGMHEPSNCRTACFLCNAMKGDRYAGEQMLLLSV